MKIVICGIFYYPDLIGVAKYTSEMAEWLQSRGHRVRVITAYPFYPAWRIKKGYPSWRYYVQNISGVRIIRCPIWVPKKPSGLTRLLHLISYAVSSLPIILWQVFWGPDIFMVVEPTFLCVPSMLMAARLSKARSWLHIQDFEIDMAFSLGLLSSSKIWSTIEVLESWFMQKCDRVSTISEHMIDRLGEKKIIKPMRVLFPNWVDTKIIFPQNHKSPMCGALGISDESIVALYSGNWGEKQGLEVIIEVARRLRSYKKITFVFCGQGAAYRRMYDSARGLNNIRWVELQPADRLNDLLNLAHIHLLPQRADAADLVMPSKLTGMLASGKAILAMANKDTQIFNLLKDKGIAISPGNVDELVSALKCLANDEKKRNALGYSARRYANDYLEKAVILANFERELIATIDRK